MRLKWRAAWLAIYPWAKLALRLRVKGRERLVPGAQILAANHVSNADPLIVGWAAAREVHFLAKEELFKVSRLFEWLIRNWNAWPVRRGAGDATAMRRCRRLLSQGQTVVLFPEGTRSRTGEMAAFRPGVGMLAITSGVPAVPTCIRGMERTLVSHLVDRDFVREGFRARPMLNQAIELVFGEPVWPGRFGHSREQYELMAGEIEDRVRKLREWQE